MRFARTGRGGEGLRIAMVSEHASPLAALGGADAGGQNVHVAALANAFASAGDQVVVHTRRDAPATALAPTVRLSPHLHVHHIDAGPPRALPKDELLPHMDAFADQLAAHWRRSRPDVVHAHFWMSGLAALAAARPLGIPVVQTFHALGVVKRRQQGVKDTSPRGRARLEPRVAREADWIVATSTDEVFELVRMGADRHRISVVPCGVDLDRFTPRGPALERNGMPRVVTLCRMVERKGVGNVISAVAELPGVELIVAGGPPRERLRDDPEARRLMRLARAAGVDGRVRFVGRVDRADVPALLRSADVVACVPWYEPFGIVPLEAMACGVAVIASHVGGHVDTVVDGVTGVHVPPRDPGALAQVLAQLLTDPARRAELGRNGARRARRGYGWPRIARLTRDVYARLVAHAAAPRASEEASA